MRRNRAHFALISVGKMGHQTLLLRLSTVPRNAVVTCRPLITPDNYWHKTTWPEFQLSLPPGHRGAYIRHNPGGICYPKCGKQTPFIPSEVRKNLIGGLLPGLYSLSMAPDYAAQRRAKSQRYHRIAAVTQDNQRR